MIRPLALILAPILVGALYFASHAPVHGPGVYVEVERDQRHSTYPLSGIAFDGTVAPAAASANAVAGTYERVMGFIVSTEGASAALPPPSVYAVVVNNADASFHSEPLLLPSTAQAIDASHIWITSADLKPPLAKIRAHYQQVLGRSAGSRATLEVFVGLVQQDAGGQRRMYLVRVAGR